jgi:predicted nucleic acid-binding protein
MKRVVVDASIAVKWFVSEIHSELAARLLDTEFIVSAPDLILLLFEPPI